MKYYCNNCHLVLDEDDLIKIEDPRPGAYGQPCWETFWVCPRCECVPEIYDEEEDEEEDEEDVE